MQAMRMILGAAVAVGAILIAAPGLCADDLEGNHGQGVCRLDGAWLGTSPAWGGDWPIVYTSVSHWTGTLSMRFVGSDPTLGGVFPVTSLSRTTGTWVRTGPRTFDYTMIHYGLAEGGQQPVFIGKLIGSVELIGECNEMRVFNWSLSIYDAAQDPFGDDPPMLCIPDGSLSTAERIPVQPPPC